MASPELSPEVHAAKESLGQVTEALDVSDHMALAVEECIGKPLHHEAVQQDCDIEPLAASLENTSDITETVRDVLPTVIIGSLCLTLSVLVIKDYLRHRRKK